MDTKGDRVRETKTERQREGQQAREEEMEERIRKAFLGDARDE